MSYVPKSADSLADFFAQIITSKHNQHAIVRIVGSAGTGKSWSGTQLAVEVAKCVAEYRHQGTWQDYFSFEKCMACMDGDRIKEVMGNPGKYNILFLDDIGVPLNARKFMSEENIDFNDVIQTFRPNNNLVIMTLQAGFLMDKVPRTLAHYEIEMEQANFNQGYTIAKVNTILVKHKTGDIYYPYILIDGTKYKRHIFEAPDPALMDEYERIRGIQLAKLQAKKQAAKEAAEAKSSSKSVAQPTMKATAKELHAKWEAGVYGKLTFKAVCIAHEINYESAKVACCG